MTFQPYTCVPGTEILHSTTDVYELYDEEEGLTHKVELQADNGGVYMEYSEKKNGEKSKLFTECMSIANKDLAIVVAKRILELYGVN
jgi:hypothetical protein